MAVYNLEVLMKICENKYEVSTCILILVIAAEVPRDKVEEVLKSINKEPINKKKDLPSACLKFVSMKKLSDKFTQDKYDLEPFVEAIKTDFKIVKDIRGKCNSDKEVVDTLIKCLKLKNTRTRSANNLSGKEMWLIREVGTYFDSKDSLFKKSYTTKHLRDLTTFKFKNIQRDHVVELQIVHKICHDLDFDLRLATEFAWHFNTMFNTELILAKDNKEKAHAVKEYLKPSKKGGKSGYMDHINHIKEKYIYIRVKILESFKYYNENNVDERKILDDDNFNKAIDKLDVLIGGTDSEYVPEDDLEDDSEDVSEDVSEDDLEDGPEDDLEDGPEDVSKDYLEDGPEDGPEDDLEDGPEDVSKDDLEDGPEDDLEDGPEDVSKAVNEDLSTETEKMKI